MKFQYLKYHSLDIDKQKEWKTRIFELALDAVPHLKREQFDAFFFNEQLDTLTYFTIENKDKKLLAFFCGYYQIVHINNRKNYVYNSRIIVSPHYQGNSLFIETFIAQFKAFGTLALRKGGYWVSNMVNPISYHGIASACKKVYPRLDTPLTPEIIQIIEAVAAINHYQLAKAKDIVKITSGFPPKYSKEQIEKIYRSDKPHIKYFLEQGIDFLNGEGIPVVVPYSFENIFLTVLGALKKRIILAFKK